MLSGEGYAAQRMGMPCWANEVAFGCRKRGIYDGVVGCVRTGVMEQRDLEKRQVFSLRYSRRFVLV